MTNFSENANARLQEMLNKPASDKIVSSEHRKVIAHICADAKGDGVSIERLIVSLKGIFDQLPAHPDGDGHSRSALRERLIAICIEEYFQDGAGPKSS